MSPMRTRAANKRQPDKKMPRKRGVKREDSPQQDPISQDSLIPNIDDLAVFIDTYKKLQTDVADFKAHITEQTAQIEQGK
ncbi:hypothetical protein PtrSN002B_009697 [Pyrenophora tritici-repentis]|uniref:Uncharacterized protein n=1 Tax=Pyrenophora tritici-repentis TaxID=45151 RepID=A0A317B7V3_9PLEO|nr:hypothetical protein PtrV1_03297 [Pyrenophora tritici-repentis]KAF7442354.1 hypothetical protein A1F99_132230 [Pyrenophora tritici-repentis]KAF7579275.1 hypothetical protein PtrM4_035150 [Pyrenophora tritici-repentis]KAG9378203.1 hypothetical protein A1F94_011319 [Pyrenophora tritici-repentis]KAI0585594.1 hypothetical protein Alg215_02400 [Pyrenophora tritici-repentis]